MRKDSCGPPTHPTKKEKMKQRNRKKKPKKNQFDWSSFIVSKETLWSIHSWVHLASSFVLGGVGCRCASWECVSKCSCMPVGPSHVCSCKCINKLLSLPCGFHFLHFVKTRKFANSKYFRDKYFIFMYACVVLHNQVPPQIVVLSFFAWHLFFYI